MRFKMVTDDHFVPHNQIFEEGNYQPLIFTFISKIQDFIFTIKKKKNSPTYKDLELKTAIFLPANFPIHVEMNKYTLHDYTVCIYVTFFFFFLKSLH